MVVSIITPTPAYVFDFPPELLRIIFELASAHPPSARALTLTSAFARAWAEPILYRTAHIATPRQLAAFHHALLVRTLRGERRGVAAPHHVRHLAIMCQASPARTEEVVRMCERVRSLACGFAWQIPLCPPEPARPEGAVPAPTEHHLLGLACRDGLDISLVPPSTTHLRVHVTCATDLELSAPATDDPDAAAPSCPFARLPAHLPRLTHLAVVYRAGLVPADKVRAALEHVLAEAPAVEVALVQAMSAQSADVSALTFDAKAAAAAAAAGTSDRESAGPDASRTPAQEARGKAPCDARVVLERVDASFSAAGQWDDQARFGGADGVWADSLAVVAARRADVGRLVRERQRCC